MIEKEGNPEGVPGLIKIIARDGSGERAVMLARSPDGTKALAIGVNGPDWGRVVRLVEDNPDEWAKVVREVTYVPSDWEIMVGQS